MRSASRTREIQDRRRNEVVVQDHVSLLASAAWRQTSAGRGCRARPYQVDLAGICAAAGGRLQFTRQRALGVGDPPREHEFGHRTLEHPFPERPPAPVAATRFGPARGKRRASCANWPYVAGTSDSRRARSRRASTGEAPPVDTATTTGERSTIAGRMNEHSSGSSTTLTGSSCDCARRETSALTEPIVGRGDRRAPRPAMRPA